MNNTNKILVWLVVLLALLNITTISSYIYHRSKERKTAETSVTTGFSNNPLNGRFFMQEVGFDEQQMEKFREANRDFKPKSNQIIFEIDSIKLQIFNELNKENIDSIKIKNLTDSFGILHAELKHETNIFYLKLKSISNKEQITKLNTAFAPLFYQTEEVYRQRNNCGYNRHRFGQRNQ